MEEKLTAMKNEIARLKKELDYFERIFANVHNEGLQYSTDEVEKIINNYNSLYEELEKIENEYRERVF